MASTSLRHASLPRPAVKRAPHTMPGAHTARNHFEDFLREIGESKEAAQFLCCVPRPSGVPCAHVHLHKVSSSIADLKARSSSRLRDEATSSEQEVVPRAPLPTSHLRPETRGRTLSFPKVSGTLTSGRPVSLKSPALSSIDLENHDAAGNYSYFSTARDSLLSCMGTIPVDERPSRALTRSAHRDGHAPSRRSSASSSASSSSSASRPSPLSSSRAIPVGRGAEQHSRPRPSARHRSSSRTPSIDSVDTASSSEAPATPRTQSLLPHELPATEPVVAQEVLPPALEELERTSPYHVPSECSQCRTKGSNFPSCRKCGVQWCSRNCRVGKNGAVAHVCPPRDALHVAVAH
ncbi:hypothetical protein C8Q80DRAFT_1266486 [Daedaleopsis nitida]|nr:hypothetical protein C8Q80DRAFT_1266486 [Daedaleopsis nitida]